MLWWGKLSSKFLLAVVIIPVVSYGNRTRHGSRVSCSTKYSSSGLTSTPAHHGAVYFTLPVAMALLTVEIRSCPAISSLVPRPPSHNNNYAHA